MKLSTTVIARTAVLSALVVVFDYVMKFSGFKIPFPWFPALKFDFTGIPIVLSALLIDLKAGAFTSAVAFLAILVRSGEAVGAGMKALAEASTILGLCLGSLWLTDKSKFAKPVSFILGCIARVLVMAVSNFPVLTLYYGMPSAAAVALIPAVAVFNVLHGLLSMSGGYLVYEALIRRAPSLISEREANRNP